MLWLAVVGWLVWPTRAYNTICDVDVATVYTAASTKILVDVEVSGITLGTNPGRVVDVSHPLKLAPTGAIVLPTVVDFSVNPTGPYMLSSPCHTLDTATVTVNASAQPFGTIGLPLLTELVGHPVTWNAASNTFMGDTRQTWRQHFADADIARCALRGCASPFECTYPGFLGNQSVAMQLTFAHVGLGVPADVDLPPCYTVTVGALRMPVCHNDTVCRSHAGLVHCRPRVFVHDSDVVSVGLDQGAFALAAHWDADETCATVGRAWGEHSYTVTAWAPFTAIVLVGLAWVLFPLEVHVAHINRRAMVLTLSAVLTFASVYGSLLSPSLAHRICRSNMFLLSPITCWTVAALGLATQILSTLVLAGGLWWDPQGGLENRQAQFYHLFLYHNILLALVMQATGGTLHGLNNYLASCFGGIAVFSLSRALSSFLANGSPTTVWIALAVLAPSFPCLFCTAFFPLLFGIDDHFSVVLVLSMPYVFWLILAGILYQVVSYVKHVNFKPAKIIK